MYLPLGRETETETGTERQRELRTSSLQDRDFRLLRERRREREEGERGGEGEKLRTQNAELYYSRIEILGTEERERTGCCSDDVRGRDGGGRGR